MATKPAPTPRLDNAPQVRSWSYNRMAVSNATGLKCEDPSRAIQSQKDEADINTIVKSFGVTGQLPAAVRLPTYGDFDGISDFRSAIEAVRAAEDAFADIPSTIRERFHHDAGAFADFCIKPENLPQLREWGLAPKPPEPAAT